MRTINVCKKKGMTIDQIVQKLDQPTLSKDFLSDLRKHYRMGFFTPRTQQQIHIWIYGKSNL